MALIKWNESLSVKVAEIDRQHQKLIAMINDLDDAMRQGKGKAVLSKIVGGLISYTGTHFSTEENYFNKFGYEDAPSHKKEHAAFVQKVSAFKADFEQGDFYEAISFLKKAYNIQPDRPELLLLLAETYYEIEDYSNAIVFYEQAKNVLGDDARVEEGLQKALAAKQRSSGKVRRLRA